MNKEKSLEVKELSKCYQLGNRQHYLSFQDVLMEMIKTPWRLISKPSTEANNKKNLWALDKVSFTMEPGEIRGVIGKNGAGKTTLLKVLSKITEPTEGKAILRGRVASLLAVGVGFHAELTGRENIYLNAILLGMRPDAIEQNLSSIIAFSQIENFLDTPLKRYSSGMYVRLAFSIAVHLSPDIFLIDELLMVSDIAFQRKCIFKIKEMATKGTSILIVSHNLETIKQLCNQVILLEQGKIKMVGLTKEVVDYYEKDSLAQNQETTFF